MSLRKASSDNSTSPLTKNMDPFHHGSYGLDKDNNGTNNDLTTVNGLYCNNSDDAENDYDGDKVERRSAAPPSGNGFLLGGVLPTFPAALSPSRPSEQNSTPPQSQHPLTPPQSSRSSTTAVQPSSLPPPFVMQITAIASLGGVLFGYDMGVIAGALPQLATTFDLTENQQELVVSILYVGGGLGAALGGTLCDVLGRKPAILWTDVGFMVGASVLFTAPHVASVCVGRVIVGFAVAVSGIADVSYLHEIAPTQWRGAIVSVNEACISLGFLLAFIVGTALTPPSSETEGTVGDDGISSSSPHPRGWRYMFGLGGVLALVQFVGMWSMPESPTWLREQGRHEESKAALRRIHGRDEVPVEEYEGSDHLEHDEDVDELANQALRQIRKSPIRSPQDAASESRASYESLSSNPISSGTGGGPESTGLRGILKVQHQCRIAIFKCRAGWNSLKRTLSKYRREVWIALFLSVTQQFCGQTSVLNYAPTILEAVVKQDNAANNDNGGDDEVSGWATLSIGLVKFIATVLVIWKIEVVGRRRLLLLGMGIIAFGLLLVAVAFSANSPYLRDQQEANGVVVQSGSGFYFALPGVLLVVSGYSMSFGPLTWLLTSELFPTDIRGRALGTSTIVTYLCAAMVTYSFLTAQSLLGTSVVFLIYMLITLVGIVFACVAIPDTGGKTLEEIDISISKMPWWRRTTSKSDEPKRWRTRSSGGRSCDGFDAIGDTLPSSTSAGRLVEAELT